MEENISSFSYDPETDVCYRTLDFMGLPGYRVGDDGSVWSRWTPGGSGLRNTWKRRISTPHRKSGHHSLLFKLNGKPWLLKVHTLVLLAFVGPRLPGMVCRHFPDRNPAKNNLANLRWGTQKENMQDAVVTHQTIARGEKHGMSRFKPDDILAMRADYEADPSEGWTNRLSIKYGTDPRTVHRIIKRERWTHI